MLAGGATDSETNSTCSLVFGKLQFLENFSNVKTSSPILARTQPINKNTNFLSGEKENSFKHWRGAQQDLETNSADLDFTYSDLETKISQTNGAATS